MKIVHELVCQRFHFLNSEQLSCCSKMLLTKNWPNCSLVSPLILNLLVCCFFTGLLWLRNDAVTALVWLASFRWIKVLSAWLRSESWFSMSDSSYCFTVRPYSMFLSHWGRQSHSESRWGLKRLTYALRWNLKQLRWEPLRTALSLQPAACDWQMVSWLETLTWS